jgi:predicted acyltransferase
MKERYLNLDALRGYAIFTMILSGSIAFGSMMPSWMFHAQVPPPEHKFNPSLPGITWVDLVFPFFIFCMGAAIPIAMKKHVVKQDHKAVFFTAFRRFFLLAFFAIFLEHFKSDHLQTNPGNETYIISLVGYFLLFMGFSKFSSFTSKKTETLINYSAIVIAVICLIFLPINNGKGVKITTSDIIIIVLANMALFGTISWWLTRNNILLRLGILPFIMAIFLGSKVPESWNEFIYLLTPSTALYKFYFLKYLFILIPGTIAGDWLLQEKDISPLEVKTNTNLKIIGLLLFILVITNVSFLYTRQLVTNLVCSMIGLAMVYFLIHKTVLNNKKLLEHFFYAGTFSLLLGLSFESYEGGIKKDVSTYSYYFVTVGLAFFSFLVLAILQAIPIFKPIHRFMSLSGQNPMMAYVSGSLLLLPLMHLVGIYDNWNSMNTNFFMGFMKGLLFTLVSCSITIPFTKKGFIWKS